MKMVRGEHLVEAVWARNWSTLWNALKRLMIPLFLQNSTLSVGVFIAVLFLLLMPFPILIYSVIFLSLGDSFVILLITAATSSSLIYVAAVLEVKKGLQLKLIHALLAPIGSFIVVSGFLSGIINAKSKTGLNWRGRNYSMKDHLQNSISLS